MTRCLTESKLYIIAGKFYPMEMDRFSFTDEIYDLI